MTNSMPTPKAALGTAFLYWLWDMPPAPRIGLLFLLVAVWGQPCTTPPAP